MSPQIRNANNSNPTRVVVTMPDPPPPPYDDADEFDNFAHLAKKLANVPKKELDEARDRYKAAKP